MKTRTKAKLIVLRNFISVLGIVATAPYAVGAIACPIITHFSPITKVFEDWSGTFANYSMLGIIVAVCIAIPCVLVSLLWITISDAIDSVERRLR
jgi:hypothetical protein